MQVDFILYLLLKFFLKRRKNLNESNQRNLQFLPKLVIHNWVQLYPLDFRFDELTVLTTLVDVSMATSDDSSRMRIG